MPARGGASDGGGRRPWKATKAGPSGRWSPQTNRGVCCPAVTRAPYSLSLPHHSPRPVSSPSLHPPCTLPPPPPPIFGERCSPMRLTMARRITPAGLTSILLLVLLVLVAVVAEGPPGVAARRRRSRHPRCSVNMCALVGSTAKCRYRKRSRRTRTCGKYARRLFVCSRWCRKRCLPPRLQPCDSSGKRHCNMCKLQRYVCRRRFGRVVGRCYKRA